MVGYYDLVLGVIPLALFGITGGLYLSGIALTSAVPAGAGVAAAVIGHAMFVRRPVDGRLGEETRPVDESSSTGTSSFQSAD